MIRRNTKGSLLAEYPAVLWMLFIGIAIPMILIASCGYRALLFYFAVRDSCYKAAKAPSFSQAQTSATTTFNTEVAAWNGISGTESIFIVTKPLNGNPPTISNTKLPANTVNTNLNIYFIREIGNGSIQPLVSGGTYMGMTIPGLTGPFPLQIKYDTYVENPSGLMN
jgi:hypothetical protein